MWSQRPVTEQGVHCEQWHGDKADREIRHCEAEQEVVADGLQLLVDFERDHHHGVAQHCDQAESAGYDCYQHHLRDGIATCPLGHHVIYGRVEHVVGRSVQHCRQQLTSPVLTALQQKEELWDLRVLAAVKIWTVAYEARSVRREHSSPVS